MSDITHHDCGSITEITHTPWLRITHQLNTTYTPNAQFSLAVQCMSHHHHTLSDILYTYTMMNKGSETSFRCLLPLRLLSVEFNQSQVFNWVCITNISWSHVICTRVCVCGVVWCVTGIVFCVCLWTKADVTSPERSLGDTPEVQTLGVSSVLYSLTVSTLLHDQHCTSLYEFQCKIKRNLNDFQDEIILHKMYVVCNSCDRIKNSGSLI